MDRSGRVINPFEIVNEGTYCKPKVPLPSLREQLPEECPPELALKRLAELTAATVAQEASLAALEEEVGALEGEGARLEEELERVGAEWRELEEDQGEAPEEEEQNEMMSWVEKVQEVRGLPEEKIAGLVSM